MPAQPVRTPDDFDHLGKAFEGLAGALHEGRAVEREDLEEACKVAHELWPARTDARDLHEAEFEAARQECRAAAPQLAADRRAWLHVERACHHLGLALRWKGRHMSADERRLGADWAAAPEARAGIHRLDRKYARYAVPPAQMPI